MQSFRPLTDEELITAYNDVFTEAFPPAELKPLSSIQAMTKDGIYTTLGLFEDDKRLLGCICLWMDRPYILIDYLCVPHTLRNGGFGAELIRRTIAAYPADTIFIGEVEAPTGNAEADAIIYRRLGFYQRCGAITLDYDTALFGVHYKTIVWGQPPIDEAEVLRHHHDIYQRRFPPEAFAAFIQIPLHPGEAVHPVRDWEQ